MNKNWLVAGGFAVAASCFSMGMNQKTVQAQDKKEAGGSLRVCVINVQQVFKDNTKFKNLMESLKGSVEAKDKELRAKDEERRGKIASVQTIKVQADRDRIEKEVRDLEFEMKKTQTRYQQEFMQREADIYSAVYKDMTDLLSQYCQYNQIHLVLRSASDSDPSNPQAVLQTVYRDVVYNHPNLDLTKVITEGLNTSQK